MYFLKLPAHSPELNPVEILWDDLREKYFGNVVFDSMQALEDHLELSLNIFELGQENVKSIVALPWIINSLLN